MPAVRYAILAATTLTALVIVLFWPTHTTIGSTHNARGRGSEDAASDLYGLGVRLGAYIQGLSALVCSFQQWEMSQAAYISLPFTLFCGLMMLAAKRNISPLEFMIVQIVIWINTLPVLLLMSLASGHAAPGVLRLYQGITLLLISGVYLSFLWFAVMGEKALPPLGVEGLNVEGGPYQYRPAYLTVIATISLLIAGILAMRVGRYLGWRAESLRKGQTFAFAPLLILADISGITAVEALMVRNRLTPNGDLTSPSQLMPLIVAFIMVSELPFNRFISSSGQQNLPNHGPLTNHSLHPSYSLPSSGQPPSSMSSGTNMPFYAPPYFQNPQVHPYSYIAVPTRA